MSIKTALESEGVDFSEYMNMPEPWEDLRKIADLAARWCRTYGYEHLSVYANEETENYTGKGIAKTENGTVQRVDIEIKKPRKITIAELEKHFGYPIEIVS
jgi:hypothetical protein